MRCKVQDEALSLTWSQAAQSPPKTPNKLRGHVNAVSPLSEVCLNAGKPVGDMKRCRPSVSPPASVLLASAGSPPSTASASSANAALELHAAGSMPHGAAPCSSPSKEEQCIATSSPRGDSCCMRELLAWQEAAQESNAPPASPASPCLNMHFRRDESNRRALLGFLYGLPQSLYAAMPDQADCKQDQAGSNDVREEAALPLHRSLLESLETEAVKAPCRLSPSPLPTPSCSPVQCCPDEGPVQAGESLVPLALEASLLEALDAPDEDILVSEADELAEFRQNIEKHQQSWPPQSILDMEDHLSRSFDFTVFMFFERRDRLNAASAHERKPAETLSSIPEYPPNWAQWQIESARSRSAMRTRKRSTSRHRSAGKDVL